MMLFVTKTKSLTVPCEPPSRLPRNSPRPPGARNFEAGSALEGVFCLKDAGVRRLTPTNRSPLRRKPPPTTTVSFRLRTTVTRRQPSDRAPFSARNGPPTGGAETLRQDPPWRAFSASKMLASAVGQAAQGPHERREHVFGSLHQIGPGEAQHCPPGHDQGVLPSSIFLEALGVGCPGPARVRLVRTS